MNAPHEHATPERSSVSQKWNEAISYEELTGLKQSWEKAQPVTVLSVERMKNGFLVTGELEEKAFIPDWLRKEGQVTLGIHVEDPFLLEGNVLKVTGRTFFLQVIEKEAEEVSTPAKMWIFPFSRKPYTRMKECVLEVMMKVKNPLAMSFLSDDKVKSDRIEVIQGPPGTGKTTEIGERCKKEYDKTRLGKSKKKKIMLTAFTHKACVNIAEKLVELEMPFLAINIRGLPDELKKHDLERKVEEIASSILGKAMKINKETVKSEIRRQLKDKVMFFIVTAMSATKQFPVIKKPPFDTVIVDEGSQIPLPIIASVATLAEKMVVFGDPVQLPPVVLAQMMEEKEKREENPLVLTVYDLIPRNAVKLLEKQYRGRPEIFLLVSALFYGGKIRTGRFIKADRNTFPVVDFINTSESVRAKDVNRINYYEASLCQEIIDELATKDSSRTIKVGAISPFRAQAEHLRRTLRSPSDRVKIDCGTVHVVQGRTYDVVILSLAAAALSPFLNPSEEWLKELQGSLPLIFSRLKRESKQSKGLGYPDHVEQLERVLISWKERLKPYDDGLASDKGDKEQEVENERVPNEERGSSSVLSLRQYECEDLNIEIELDLERLQLPENQYATNIFNVALSRARTRLVVLGYFDVLHENPLVDLIHSWIETFKSKASDTGPVIKEYLLQAITSLIEALENDNEWNALTFKPDHQAERIDITWHYAEKCKVMVIKAFRKRIEEKQVRKLAKELERSSTAGEYRVQLLGDYDDNIPKFHSVGNMVILRPKPLDSRKLAKQVYCIIDRYLENRGHVKMTANKKDPLQVLASRIGLLATKEKISREEFNEILFHCFL
ncbi:MAG: DEAD/DEAH box helicase [Candidatus Odinarchaeota archaeon]